MIRCPICHRTLSPSKSHPYASICSDACRREALLRAGVADSSRTEAPEEEAQPEQFEKLVASHLFCPRCKELTPAREQLLLMLPDCDLYGYSCARCGADVGKKTDVRRADSS